MVDKNQQLYSAEQVRELDRITIEEYGVPGFELMSRAGAAAFAQLLKIFPNIESIAVFCGAGNNAGDGYVLATLALQHGLKVSVYNLVDCDRLAGDALTAAQQYTDAGGLVHAYKYYLEPGADVLVDAIFGTGLSREVNGVFADAVLNINSCETPVVALDIPSGLNADTGSVMGVAVFASLTVTFIALKKGLYTANAADYTGTLLLEDLDVPDSVYQAIKPFAKLTQAPSFKPRSPCVHKGNFGHVLVIGGDSGYAGAALMAAMAAARVGAGLVSVATRSSHTGSMVSSRPELMCHGVENPEQLAPLLQKATVIVIGPGLGTSEWGKGLFAATKVTEGPLLIDADGLNLLANCIEGDSKWVITPHPGEAGRLLGIDSSRIQANRFTAVEDLFKKYQATVLLKGFGTLIYDGHEFYINPTGNPGMASGGYGDVLSGIIAGLIAQGFPHTEAVRMGAFIHGEAADRAALEGQRGMLAGDLLPYLRKLVNSL